MEKRESKSSSRITDYSVYLNASTKRRKPYRAFMISANYMKAPEAERVFFAAGIPNKIQFPTVSASFKTRDGCDITFSPQEMESALQYVTAGGLRNLRIWLEELARTVHSPPTLDDQKLTSSLETILCSGIKEGMSKCVDILLEDGDSLLTEEFIYQPILHMCQPRGIKRCPIKSDEEGMDAGHLKQILSNWNEDTQGRLPRLLYIIPTYSNPTGKTLSGRRRQEIYNIARQFELLIIEDDPYYHLQVKKPFPPSLLSLDVDGRVIRFDSFTKIISPGVRLGIIHGPKGLLDEILYSLYNESQGPSSLSQMFVWKVLEHWGMERYIQHGEMLADFYKDRIQTMLKLMDKYLKGLVEWTPPDGGMFVWIKIPGLDNPLHFMDQLMKRGVFVLDGIIFSVDMLPKPFFRLCVALATDQEMEKGIKRIGELVQEMKRQGRIQ